MPVKLLYKAEQTYLKTSYPAHYYGSPDNKVYIIYKTQDLSPTGNSVIEFFIARHEEFGYNYIENKLVELKTKETPLLNSFIDKPNMVISNVENPKNCKSYENALERLNTWIIQEISSPPKPYKKL